MAAAPLQLDGQVEPLGPHAGEEPLDLGGRSWRPVVTHPDGRRHGQAAVDWARPAGQEAGVPAGPQPHQLGGRVGGTQGLDGGQADQIVADRVGPQHGQLVDTLDPFHAVAHQPPDWGGTCRTHPTAPARRNANHHLQGTL